jgi:hypothetical protein
MKETLIVGNRIFEVASPLTQLTPEQKVHVMQHIINKIQGSGISTFGTATCGGPYLKDTSHTLTGSVTSGGTTPFTYNWTITKPDGTKDTRTGASQTYVFTQVGTYKIDLVVTDSCASGAKSDSATCNVVITAECVTPVCNINMA